MLRRLCFALLYLNVICGKGCVFGIEYRQHFVCILIKLRRLGQLVLLPTPFNRSFNRQLENLILNKKFVLCFGVDIRLVNGTKETVDYQLYNTLFVIVQLLIVKPADEVCWNNSVVIRNLAVVDDTLINYKSLLL